MLALLHLANFLSRRVSFSPVSPSMRKILLRSCYFHPSFMIEYSIIMVYLQFQFFLDRICDLSTFKSDVIENYIIFM